MELPSDEPAGAGPVLDALTGRIDELSPQVRQAGRFVLDNPGAIAVTSMRGVADAAGVKPNTLVRLARAMGFDSYEGFREPFRRQASTATPSFPDRARFLQSINAGGRHGALLADMAAATLRNVEALVSTVEADELKQAADLIADARRANILGVGTARPLADNFAYVASMGIGNVTAIPTIGLAIDDVARMDDRDVLVAMTFSPYRVEIVEAVRLAGGRDVPVIAITDSRAAPIAAPARHAFTVPTDSPLPFSSTIAATALLEALLAFVMADATGDVVGAIDTFHDNRRHAGIYWES